MKNLLSLSLVLILLFGLCACGSSLETSEPVSSVLPNTQEGAADGNNNSADGNYVAIVTTTTVSGASGSSDSVPPSSNSGENTTTGIASTSASSDGGNAVVATSNKTSVTQAGTTTTAGKTPNKTSAATNVASTTAADGPIVTTTTHRHSWIKTTKQPPTCTEQGYTLVEYSCGKKEKKDYVPALGHSMSDWKTTLQPTNKTPGEARRECKYTSCNYFETKQIAVLPSAQTKEQKAILDLVNAERTKVGLKELSYYRAEQAAADQRAEDIKVHFSHYRPNGSGGDGDPFYVLLKGLGTDYFGCGENVAMHFHEAAQVMKGWMDSPKHKANILDPDFDALVVGFSDDYWVQIFIDFG